MKWNSNELKSSGREEEENYHVHKQLKVECEKWYKMHSYP